MDVGIVVPQGWAGEFAGWEPADAWRRILGVATDAERLGFESVWAYDHFQTHPRPTDEPTFEAFTVLAALAQATTRVRMGPLVACAGYRNPALLAKMAATLDVVSGGRLDLGLGAGWKRDEYEAYGYGFPSLADRMAALEDALEICSRMLEDGHATYEGRTARVRDAINEPRGIQQPRVRLFVGGNGPNRTFRLAARYADELNLDGTTVADTRALLPIIAQRCEEIGRDPVTLNVSVHVQRGVDDTRGRARQDALAEYQRMGISRVQVLLRDSPGSDEPLAAFAEDVRAAGLWS